jgi:hypothetical protein
LFRATPWPIPGPDQFAIVRGTFFKYNHLAELLATFTSKTGKAFGMEQRIAIGRSDRYWLAMLSPAFWIGSIRQDVSDLLRFRYAFAILVANQLKVRYQRSVLGFLWTLLNPLLMLTVLAVFLSQVLRMQVEHYAV